MSNKSTQSAAVTVANALALLERFRRERDELTARKATLAENRRAAAFTAHAGDGSASKLLNGLHREAAELESRLVSIDDAIAEAGRRVDQARAAEARAADREQALALRQALADFVAAGKGCDAALELLISASTDLRSGITAMNRLGCSHPSHAQLDALGSLALRSAIMATPWARDIERVGPLEKKTFSGLVAAWAAQVERSISARLADVQPDTNEAA
jgi:hypothetical protein